jgi:Arc/MetJ-type ribon-helix-helix transcriptional regulator
MKRIDVVLPDELEEQFRIQVAKKMGMKKGNLSKAVQEAIENWLKGDE